MKTTAKLKDSMRRIPIWVFYVAIVIGVLLSYQPAREGMIMQSVWVRVIHSSVTLNFVLFLFLWGVTADKWTKKMPKKKGWLIWGIGFMAILAVWRFVGGYETIFALFILTGSNSG